jgi:hypothetical protein
MKKRYETVLKIILISVVLLIVVLYFIPSSVLLRFEDKAVIDPAASVFVIFNPMRNRQPEKAAAVFLRLLKGGKCQEAVAVLPDKSNYNEYICGKENEHRLTDWELVDRNDESEKTVVHYKAYRVDYSADLYGNIWITVMKQNGGWKVTGYEAWY